MKIIPSAALSLALVLIAGCSLFGTNPKGPTKIERGLFDVVTNIVVVTNAVPVPVPVYVTNQVLQTNIVAGAPVVASNAVVVIDHYVTNTVMVTSNVEALTLTTSDKTKQGINTIGTALNTFLPGVGTAVSLGLAGLAGLWGYLRSSKLVNTAGALAQEIETIRQFVRALPNGAQYDTTLVNFLQQHQNETNSIKTVLDLLANSVSNSDAKVAANQIINVINGLNAPHPTPVVPIGPVT